MDKEKDREIAHVFSLFFFSDGTFRFTNFSIKSPPLKRRGEQRNEGTAMKTRRGGSALRGCERLPNARPSCVVKKDRLEEMRE